MEAPEKIYLYPSNKAGEEYEDDWGIVPWGKDYVEYTRTDAFIEKACQWLEDNKDHPFIECEDHQLAGFLTNEFIEDFKNYMKGKKSWQK